MFELNKIERLKFQQILANSPKWPSCPTNKTSDPIPSGCWTRRLRCFRSRRTKRWPFRRRKRPPCPCTSWNRDCERRTRSPLRVSEAPLPGGWRSARISDWGDRRGAGRIRRAGRRRCLRLPRSRTRWLWAVKEDTDTLVRRSRRLLRLGSRWSAWFRRGRIESPLIWKYHSELNFR